MKQLWILLLILGIAWVYAWPANAHITQTSGPISVLLHAEPGDQPKAGGKSVLNFFLSDKAKTFNTAQCDCRLMIARSGQTVFEQSAFTDPNRPAEGNAVSVTSYVFKDSGAYQVKLTAKPKPGASFSAFNFTFDQRVEPGLVIFGGLSDGAKLALGSAATIIILAGIAYYIAPKLNLRRPKIPDVSRTTIMVLVVVLVTNVVTAVVVYHWSIRADQPAGSSTSHSSMIQAGDKSKRYNVAFNAPVGIQPNVDTPLVFTITEAATGTPVTAFTTLFEKPAHLVVVDEELNYYNHIHPQQSGEQFTITTQFPHNGRYRMYLNFHPVGGKEQQLGFSLSVGDGRADGARHQLDTATTKTFGAFRVTLNQLQIRGTDLASGRQKLSFAFKDAQSGQPVTTLKPYLAAFGHLVMINQETYEYIHVHPADMKPPAANASGGPTVEFAPMNLTTPIKPGTYRLFGQFNPNSQLMVADYTVQVR